MKLERLAGCLIINNEKVLMVKEAKDAYWKIPSGKVDENESLEDCAIRETEEETGKKVEVRNKFGTYKFCFKGRRFQLTVYEAGIMGKGNKNIEDNVNSVRWTPISKMSIGANDIPSNQILYKKLMREGK